MASRRMFSLDVVDSDDFLSLSKTAQLLYFHLGMRADDDGFVRNPNSIMSLISVKKPAYNELVSKNWLIEFNSGIVVVTHWKQNNYLRSDRYKPTLYQEEVACLAEKNGVYVYKPDTKMDTKADTSGISSGIPNGYQTDTNMDTQYSIGKYSVDKYSIGECSVETRDKTRDKTRTKANQNLNVNDNVNVNDNDKDNVDVNVVVAGGTPYIPTLESIQEYIHNNNYTYNPEKFYNYYQARNWYIGGKRIKDFEALKAAMDYWQSREQSNIVREQVNDDTPDYLKPIKEWAKMAKEREAKQNGQK